MSTLEHKNAEKLRLLAGAIRAARALARGDGILGKIDPQVAELARKSRRWDDTIHGMERELVARTVFYFAADWDRDDAINAYPELAGYFKNDRSRNFPFDSSEDEDDLTILPPRRDKED